MVVDTSALAAILLGAPERETFEDLILRAPAAVTSAFVPVELAILLHAERPDHQPGLLDDLLSELRIDVRPFDAGQGALARDAFARFGRGRHPAGLTLPDCLVYGLAKSRGDDILFRGEGFGLTDLRPAWRPDPVPADAGHE